MCIDSTVSENYNAYVVSTANLKKKTTFMNAYVI